MRFDSKQIVSRNTGTIQFGFTKTRYRGLIKNTVPVNMLMGLANLYLLRRQLMVV